MKVNKKDRLYLHKLLRQQIKRVREKAFIAGFAAGFVMALVIVYLLTK